MDSNQAISIIQTLSKASCYVRPPRIFDHRFAGWISLTLRAPGSSFRGCGLFGRWPLEGLLSRVSVSASRAGLRVQVRDFGKSRRLYY